MEPRTLLSGATSPGAGGHNDVVLTASVTDAPTVTGFTPSSGIVEGGDPVTITGTGFTGATAVDFGSTAATDLLRGQQHDDQLQLARWHRHRRRDGDDTRRHVGHLTRRSVHLLRASAATVTGITPNSGPAGGCGDDHRDRLHLQHHGRFRHHAGDVVSVDADTNDTMLRAVVPPGSGVVNVTVTGLAGRRRSRRPISTPTPRPPRRRSRRSGRPVGRPAAARR